MPITPEQAQAELRRREALAELERRGASPTPEGTWPGEVYRALNRTARQTAAAAPGTLATLIQAGSSPNAYGRWAPAPTPEMEEHTKQTVRVLRRTAELTHKSAEVPELAPRKGGVGGFVVNTGAGALGYMGGAAASAAVAGPAGPFLYGMTTGGESMYQEAMKDMEARKDLTPGEKHARAEVERVVFGPIYGLIEKLQVGKALKPAAVRPLLDAARRRAWGEFARLGGKATAQHLIDAGWEGVEEALQETTEIAAGTVHGRTPQRSDVGRVGTAFAGGTIAGGILKGGRTAVDAVSELRTTPPIEPGPMTYTAGEDTSSPGAEIEPLGWGESVQEGTQLSGSMDVFTQAAPVVEAITDPTDLQSLIIQDPEYAKEIKGYVLETPASGIEQTLADFANTLGVKLHIVSNVPMRGFHAKKLPGQVFVRRGTDSADMIHTAAHEIVHDLADNKPDVYAKIKARYRPAEIKLWQEAYLAQTGAAENPEYGAYLLRNPDILEEEAVALLFGGEFAGDPGRIINQFAENLGSDFRMSEAAPPKSKGTAEMTIDEYLKARGAPTEKKIQALLAAKKIDKAGADRLRRETERLRQVHATMQTIAGERSSVEKPPAQPPAVVTPETTLAPDDSRPPISTRNVDAATVRAEGGSPDSRIRHGATKEIADKMGLTPTPMPPHETREQWYAEAFEGGDPARLVPVAEVMLEQEPRALTAREAAGFDLAIQRLEAEWNDAAKTRLGMSKDDPQFAILTARLNAAATALDPIRRVADPAGRIAGQQLVARRGLHDALNDDSSGLSVVTRATTIKEDKLTEAEQEQFVKDADDVKGATEELQQIEKQLTAEEIGLPVKPPAPRKGRKKRLRGRRKPRGVERYASMTEAEKDAEVQGLLAGDVTDPVVLTRLAENIASRPEVKTFEEVLNRVGVLVPGITENTLIDSVTQAGQRKARQAGAMTARIRELLKGPAKTNTKLAEVFQDILYYLERGEVRPGAERAAKPEAEINRRLRGAVDLMRQMQRNSLPEVRARLEKQIDYFEARIANEDYAPRTPRRERPQYERELYRQRAKIAKLRSTIHNRFERVRPRDAWQKVGHIINEVFHLQKAVKGSIDDSAFGNQGGWQLRAHPIRSLRRLPWAYRGVLSDADALRMQAEIDERPNAWMDQAFGLAIRDVSGDVTFTHGEDLLRTTWAQYIPILKQTSAASNRLFALRTNRYAADALDAWVATAYRAGETPTLAEGRAMANLINITLGRGDVGKLNKAVEVAGSVMWAPRKFINDIQLALHLPLILRQPKRVRNYFIKEIARHALGSALFAALLSAVWGLPEDDSRSSMFMQWRIPGTRTYVSPFGPLPRIMALMRQIWSGERKTKAGEIVPIRGGDVPAVGQTGLDLVEQMITNRLAPGPRVISETLLTGTDFKGDPITFWRSLAESITPIAPEDIYKVMREDMEVPDAVASSAMAWFGASVNVHEEQETRGGPRRRAIRRR